MGFKKISLGKFEEFHHCFNGEFFELCAECGGWCEYSCIGTLLPGEAEYIARTLGDSILDFENKYLDKIVLPEGEVSVLKLGKQCLSLDEKHRCIFEKVNAKLVICDIYPLVLHLTEEGMFKPYIDNQCPLSRYREIRRHFEEKGAELVARIGITKSWFRAVAPYESGKYDYQKLLQFRKLSLGQCESFELEDILRCKI